MPAVGNDGNRVVRDGSSVEATARILAAATFGGGAAASHYAACDVVAGEDDLEVVGDEGAHVAVKIGRASCRERV